MVYNNIREPLHVRVLLSALVLTITSVDRTARFVARVRDRVVDHVWYGR